MDFQACSDMGYYFDRCVDLWFYDSNNYYLGCLKTPKTGIKPSITVKGTLIEGSYAISSYISVQNMGYDIDVNSVAFIRCKMYYGSLVDAKNRSADLDKARKGHEILFSVLYADQEKEPPNRAVRFQCTVAAYDYTRFDTYVDVTDGTLSLMKNGEKRSANVKVGKGGKGSSGENITSGVKMLQLVKELAKLYNEGLESVEEYDDRGNRIKNRLNQKKEMEITAVAYDEDFKKVTISLPDGEYKLGELIRYINKMTVDGSYRVFRTYISAGVIFIDKVVPRNWREIAVSEGNKTRDKQDEWYQKTYVDRLNQRKIEYINKDGYVESGKSENPVPLYYVKMAYRNEVVITASTIFDDRIYPGCYCLIRGNAVMGKHSSSKGRLTQLTNQDVIFRATGAIEYEFSTTEGSSMTITGPVTKLTEPAKTSSSVRMSLAR